MSSLSRHRTKPTEYKTFLLNKMFLLHSSFLVASVDTMVVVFVDSNLN
jgi:hypothetical protein